MLWPNPLQAVGKFLQRFDGEMAEWLKATVC
jgi:hypothetical protein